MNIMTATTTTASEMRAILDKQKAAHIRDGIPSAATRIARIDKAIDLLVTHCDALCDAVRDDFGHRSVDQTRLTDVSAAIMALKHAKKNVKKWMRPEKRKSEFPLGLLGARSVLHYQPKGVVGIVSPWNFPIGLSLGPLSGVLAAGNRAMIKTSEFTPRTSQLTQELVKEYFDEEEVCVITGGPEEGAAFTKMPFDHILFTGATSIAKHVMHAAADNLVPLTLELGGKSPVVISESADIEKSAARVMNGKMLNSGQICLAPDYVFVPENKKDEFIQACKKAVETMFPTGLINNDDYTGLINKRHYQRISGYLQEAKEQGATVIEINTQNEDFKEQKFNKMAPHLIDNPTDSMQVLQDEIFGPVMPIKTYSKIEDVINYVNDRPRPLALYYFGQNQAEQDTVLNNTTSGGVTINDVIFHCGQEDLPFGGVGDSGMGAYHGEDGFKEFSHKKAVFKQIGSELLALLRPPYGEKYRKQVAALIKR